MSGLPQDKTLSGALLLSKAQHCSKHRDRIKCKSRIQLSIKPICREQLLACLKERVSLTLSQFFYLCGFINVFIDNKLQWVARSFSSVNGGHAVETTEGPSSKSGDLFRVTVKLTNHIVAPTDGLCFH